jgi:hypothetical protein
MKARLQFLVTGAVAVIISTSLLGCKSLDKTATESFASVRIDGHTPEQIRGATAVVFQQDGYTAVEVRKPEMVFEKEGSRWDQIAYGSWVNDADVWVRVRVSVVPLSGGEFRLQCRAFKVRNKGDPLTEEQVRMRSAQSKPFQVLLDKVSGQLKW